MTHAFAFVLLLRDGPKTLGQIIRADGMRFCAEYRKLKTMLNHKGYDIRYHRLRRDGSCEGCYVNGAEAKPDCPSRFRGEAVYVLHGEPLRIESNGQLVIAGL